MRRITIHTTLCLGFLILAVAPLHARDDDKAVPKEIAAEGILPEGVAVHRVVIEEEIDGVKTYIEEGTILLEDGATMSYSGGVTERIKPNPSLKSSQPPSPSFRIEEGQDRDEFFISIIRETYSKLEAYANFKGPYSDYKGRDLRLSLSNFETLDAAHFDEIYYVNLLTFPTTDLLQIGHAQFSDSARNLHTVEYVPTWRAIDTDWLSFPEGRRMQSMTLKEVLDELSSTEDPEWRSTVAVTRFEVEIDYEGRHLSYNAAFFWLSGTKANEWRLRTLDLVAVGGVDRILIEEIPVGGKPLDPERKVGEKQFSGGDGCYTSFNNETVWSPTYTGTNDHLWGGHAAFGDASFRCDCESDCRNTCSAFVPEPFCGEMAGSQPWSACHAFKVDYDGSYVSEYGIGAKCAGGFICGQKACTFCACGMTVSLTIMGGGVTFASTGTDWTGRHSWNWQCTACQALPPPGSPILLNFRGDFELTGLDSPVLFDIDADGDKETISWTAADADDGFLALDRDGNGRIDRGDELFGTFTDQPESDSPNGYLALGVFDLADHGGNEDNQISSADAIYHDLRIWRDRNHDGISQIEELATLAAMEVDAIGLDYVLSQRRDRHGNELRWQGKFYSTRKARAFHTSDVIFLEQESK